MLENIKKRRSIRQYSEKNIDDETIKELLHMGMLAPSAINARDYAFIVIRDKETINKMVEINGNAAKPLLGADVAILVCGDTSKSYQKAKDYFVIDCAAAIENILISATELGIGSLWIGTYPQMEKVKGHQELFNLPEHIIPHSIIALGYPLNPEELNQGSRGHLDETLIHIEKW